MSDRLRPDLTPAVRQALVALVKVDRVVASTVTPKVALLTILEAAAILGLDRSSLFRLAKAGQIRWFDIGRAPMFDLADIRAFDRSTPIPPRTRRHLRKTISVRTRFRVLERDGFRCVYCGATAQDNQLVLDHVVSVADGGSDDETNLVTACAPCNSGKGKRSLLVVV